MLRLKRKQAKTLERLKKIHNAARSDSDETAFSLNDNNNNNSTTSKEDEQLSRKGEDFEKTKHGKSELPLGTLKWNDSKKLNNNIVDYNKLSPLLD